VVASAGSVVVDSADSAVELVASAVESEESVVVWVDSAVESVVARSASVVSMASDHLPD
jgi:hypothetical protein